MNKLNVIYVNILHKYNKLLKYNKLIKYNKLLI